MHETHQSHHSVPLKPTLGNKADDYELKVHHYLIKGIENPVSYDLTKMKALNNDPETTSRSIYEWID